MGIKEDRDAFSLAAQTKALTRVQNELTSVVGPALGKVSSALYTFYGAVIAAVGR